ncbi:MFS transporter [Mycobacterium simiae]|uniref:MFS transporter n=1 Tax=Mycobacterium simiae TaxID=1784 RepID=A0A5B1BEC2_MYCSI|nr:MFS transporter [Mycobacterium simiae]KAA1245674.1 MFS transporter [Mycobacterium simiae]
MLLINQLGINVGFYMLMPYLAGYLAGPLGLAAWAVGLVVGVRDFSELGMFIVGGTLAERWGYKGLIVAGCMLRVGGFAMLVVVQSLPAVLLAAAATGLAGALFNPAIRAYLAADVGDRRVEAFAMFNIFNHAGILLGPLIGLALVAIDFRVSAAGAAVVFAALTAAQLLALPAHAADLSAKAKASVLHDWRVVLANRSFLLFAAAMTGSYVLSFQIYLALPLQASILVPRSQSFLVAALFVVSGAVAIVGQLRITGWMARLWGPRGSLSSGVTIQAASFLPLIAAPVSPRFGAVAVCALVLTAAVLAVGSAGVFPFEMDTVVSLGGRLVATHYGLYYTIVGTGILLGNLGTGAVMGAARRAGISELAWAALMLLGVVSAVALRRLDRAHRLQPAGDDFTA